VAQILICLTGVGNANWEDLPITYVDPYTLGLQRHKIVDSYQQLDSLGHMQLLGCAVLVEQEVQPHIVGPYGARQLPNTPKAQKLEEHEDLD